MLTQHQLSILEDLHAGVDVVNRLKVTFALPSGKLPRNQRLELTKLVLDATTNGCSDHGQQAFLEAIYSLRSLTPFLKAKSQSTVNTVASIEKYSINHACFLCFEGHECSERLAAAAKNLATDSLNTIYAARGSPPKRTRSNSQSRKAPPSKENEDPQLTEEDTTLLDSTLDVLMFKSAAKFGLEGLLPQHDSALVAAVICGALVVNFTLRSATVQLSELVGFAKKVVVPWIRYLQSCELELERQYSRNHGVYMKRIKQALLKACSLGPSDPCTVLRVRAFALTLGEIKLSQYAKDLLRSTHCLTRSKNPKKPSTDEVYEVVGRVYDEALKFVSSFEMSDRRWFSEDVSAWMDHVAIVWQRRTTRRPAPNIFSRRIAALKRSKDDNGILECCELQLKLIKANAYASSRTSNEMAGGDYGNASLWTLVKKQIARCPVPNLAEISLHKTGREHLLSNEAYSAERVGMQRLRFLRVVEPLRRCLIEEVSCAAGLPQGAQLLLETYLGALLDSLLRLKYARECGREKEWHEEVRSRLDKMTSAAIEAAKEMIRQYYEDEREADITSMAGMAQKLIALHAKTAVPSAKTLSNWISGAFHALLKKSFEDSRTLSSATRDQKFMFIARLSEAWQRHFSLRDEEIFGDPVTTGFLEVARACYGSLKDWANSTRCTVEVLSWLLRAQPSRMEQINKKTLQKAFHSFARDVVRALAVDECYRLQVESVVLAKLLLSATIEYSVYVKKSNAHLLMPHRGNCGLDLSLYKASAALLQRIEETEALCIVQKLHLHWIMFVTQQAPLHGVLDSTNRVGLIGTTHKPCCNFRVDHSLTDTRHVGCSIAHAKLLQGLGKIAMFASRGEIRAAAEGVEEIAALLAPVELFQNMELMHVCNDILSWVGSTLAVADFHEGSSVAYDGARKCRESLGVRTRSVPMLTLCRHLGCLGSRAESLRWQQRYAWGHVEDAADRFIYVLDSVNADENSARRSRGCGSNDHIRTATDLLDSAKKDLKSAIRAIMRPLRPYRDDSEGEFLNVAGTEIGIAFDSRLESGQIRLFYMLVVINKLFWYARVLQSTENFADGRYYLGRCLDLARHCLPQHSFFRTSVSATSLFPGMSSESPPCPEGLSDLSTLAEVIEPWRRIPGRSVIAESVMVYTVTSVGLYTLSCHFSRPPEKSAGATFRRIQESCGALIQGVSGDSHPHVLHLTTGEIQLAKALLLAMQGSDSAAREVLDMIIKDQKDTLPLTRAIALYLIARHQFLAAGGFAQRQSTSNCAPKVVNCRRSTRVTRSRARLGKSSSVVSADDTLSEIREMLLEAWRDMPDSFPCPRFYRRAWKMLAILEAESDAAISALQRSVGCTFDIRYAAALSKRLAVTQTPHTANQRERDHTESLSDALRSLALTRSQYGDIDRSKLMHQLGQTECIVVGLSLDETQQCLIMWRISSNSVLLKRLRLPLDNTTSFPGVVQRIARVCSSMKEKSIKVGQTLTRDEKQDWWDHRYSLDKDLQNILADIEEEWLQECHMLLAPFIFDDMGFDKPGQSGDSSIELLLSKTRPVLAKFSELSSVQHNSSRRRSPDLGSEDVKLGQLVLVIDTSLESIPWESLPVLRSLGVSATRVPSLPFLYHHLMRPEQDVNPNDLFYVVNPAGDLQRTEDTFREVLKSHSWTGSFGKVSKADVLTRYDNENIFLYCGHGAGDQFFSPRNFTKHPAPIALLMGCSSARPENTQLTDCESSGPTMDYLIHGSRAVVGNLWDVSDKDIDRFTSSVLSHWLGLGIGEDELSKRSVSLAEAVSASRSACRLPYLVGAAAIIIGAPNIRACSTQN